MKTFKTTYKILAMSLSLLGLSCTNLDETVYDSITAETTQLSSEDLTSIVAPAYTSFRTVYWGWNGLFDVYEESSDLIVTPFRVGIGWGDLYINMHQHTWGPNQGHVEGLWSTVFTGINSVNRAIYQIENLEGVDEKEAYIQELKALRGIYYYLLLDNFRNVPISTDFIVPDGYLPEQNSTAEVYDFIESELMEAIPYLSEENNQATYGKVTKWAAKMTLAKLYLNSEVYLGTPRWGDALAEVNDIIDSGKFSLAAAYSDPFIINNETSAEEIFSIPFDDVLAGGSYYVNKTLHPASQATYDLAGAPWGGSGGIPQFIDTYDEDDERLNACWLSGPQYSSSGQPIMVDGVQLNYTNFMTNVNGALYNEGYRFIKYEIGPGNQASLGNDVPFYRLTDALMIKAECLLRTGDASGAAEIVSSIRTRAFKSNPVKATVTADKLLGGSVYEYGTYDSGEITNYEGGADIQYGGFLDELAWEFVGEHHRKQDLIRFGVYTTKSWLSHTPNGEFRTVFPIPESQMNTNSNLVQNPGY